MSSPTSEVFSLSALADDIRKTNPKYATKHDDYLCVAAFASDVSPSINVTAIEPGVLSEVGPLTKTFLERLFELRNKLVQRYTAEAELQYNDLKGRVAELSKTESELVQMKDVPNSEMSTAFTLIKNVDTLRSAINTYYKVKVEQAGGQKFFEKLGDIVFTAIKCLSSGKPIPVSVFYGELWFLKDPMTKLVAMLLGSNAEARQVLVGQLDTIFKALRARAILPDALFAGQLVFLKEPLEKLLVLLTTLKGETQLELTTRFDEIARLALAAQSFPEGIFTEETSFLEEPLVKVSKLFMAVRPVVRQELVGRFNGMMKALLACFVLYRFPVLISRTQKPVYFSRFISAIKLSQFLELYGLELGSFTIVS